MGRKKKYIEMFGSFMEPFKFFTDLLFWARLVPANRLMMTPKIVKWFADKDCMQHTHVSPSRPSSGSITLTVLLNTASWNMLPS